ncbi:ABC transporter permease [Dactylosporangium siamense]|uniref:Nitrate ABC transporter permease n=1 Tax=Dactylosporangium siamense TaxID=685454 RepID=A0A919PUA0_9ACTN|nr:ABC transporter permease [Dactylosporangium siamense]GIG49401.1 nitrate ABC transporter permease [Dactylosporangium siamense]
MRGLLGAAGFVALLEAAPRLGLVPAAYLPPASRIAAALGEEVRHGTFWVALLDTLQTWAYGLAVAVVCGVAAGMLIGSVPLLRVLTSSTVEFLRPIPSVALIPLAVLLYGTGRTATLLLVVYASFWQVLVQVLHGVADVDPVARDTAHSLRLSPWQRLRTLVWPTALPYTVTGIRLATSVALILTITGELIIGTPGLGKEIAVAQSSGAVPAMYALVVVTGLLGVAVNLATRSGERRLLRWHPSQRVAV